MKACYIFGALKSNTLLSVPQSGDLIIAADRGLLSVEKLGLSADFIIGDFDSLGFVPDRKNIIKLPVKKDDTDVGAALDYAFKSGFRRFYLYGVLGGRLDHTVANIQLAAAYSEKGADITLYGEGVFASVITDGSIRLENKTGVFSVFSLSETCGGVSIRGAEYELENSELKSDFPLGVSNRFKGPVSEISVKKGTLLLIVCKE